MAEKELDIKQALYQINELEREKAQVELLAKQLKEKKADLIRRVDEMKTIIPDLTTENLDDKISELESKIRAQLKAIGAGTAAPVESGRLGVLDI